MKLRCFLLSALGAPGTEIRHNADLLYESVVVPACEAAGFELIRVDKLLFTGTITQQVTKLLLEVDLVIADLTNNNPNVLYELGVRHATQLPVIMIARQGERLPFDVAAYRTLFYELETPSGVHKFKLELEESLNNVAAGRIPPTPTSDVSRQTAASSIDGGRDISNLGPILRSVSERLSSLEHAVHELASRSGEEQNQPVYTRDVFIVHGHDGDLKNDLARFLERLGFNPIILHEQPDRGLTIPQKLSLESSRVGYAFILHTPDDEGRNIATSTTLEARSRQNVVFEHGMFVGKFSASRVCAIVREGVEIPSDLSGVIYKRIPKGAGITSIALELIKELREAGYVVDANKA
jgi:predicted nucleotide-binding protein